MQDPTAPDPSFDDGAAARARHRAPATAGAPATTTGDTDGVADGGTLEVVRSEERLLVGTTRAPAERIRIHRDVVVEQVTRTFDVRREVLRIEREPVAPTSGARDLGPTTAPPAIEVVLREERLIVDVELVPVERVHVSVVDIAETVRVAQDVRLERVELDPLDRSAR